MTTDSPRAPAAAPPACGACGYDTTGLASLTCPECGSDLRTVGIHRGPRTAGGAGFAAQALALLVPWLACGFLLAAAVMALTPQVRTLRENLRLAQPQSGAYQSVDVVVTASGPEGQPPRVGVELQLTPSSASGAQSKLVTPLAAAPGVSQAAVLNWMAGAGIDVTDPRVRDEAQAVAMAAVRGLRTRERYAAGNYSNTSVLMSGTAGPFGSVSTTAAAGAAESRLPFALFAAAWVALLAASLRFLWRARRPGAGPRIAG